MNNQTNQIIDPNRNMVATGQVAEKEGRFSGRVDLALMPASLRQLFEEFEVSVNEQVFSLLDEAENPASLRR